MVFIAVKRAPASWLVSDLPRFGSDINTPCILRPRLRLPSDHQDSLTFNADVDPPLDAHYGLAPSGSTSHSIGPFYDHSYSRQQAKVNREAISVHFLEPCSHEHLANPDFSNLFSLSPILDL